ncbi:MAG: OmpH family outer membrane protein [Terracidiphilus sp.]|jgi:outer membrane protein
MKRTLVLAVTLASGFALGAAAQTPSAPAPAKIAVIAFQAAVGQTNEFQRNFADLQKKFEPKEAQLKAANEDLDNMKKQLQAQGDKLTEAERKSKARTIDEKGKQLQRSIDDTRNDFQQEMQEMYAGVASKVYDVLSGYAKQEGYTLVLDAAQQQGAVLWAVDSSVITKQVIDAYNVKSGIPAPPAQPAAAAPKPPVAH